jgi:predicted transcriptional regulator
VRFEPGSFASQQWADAAKPPAGKVYGHGKGYFEYHISLPATVVKAHPESIYYLFQASSKANRERVDWPQRVNRQDYPQTDMARTWPSSLAVSLNGRLVERINLPDDPADARGVLSHLAGVEHGSHGELVDGKIDLTELDRARLSAGEPLVLRLSVPDDATHPGGLCIFGASTGELPLDPTLQVHTREPLPDDLGVDPNAPVTAPLAPR